MLVEKMISLLRDWKKGKSSNLVLENDVPEDEKAVIRRSYVKTVIASAIMFAAVILFELIKADESYKVMAIISDAFMVPGMFFLAVALFKLAGYYGAFDLVLYTASWTVSTMSKYRDTDEERRKRSQSFPDYKKERQLNRVFPRASFAVGSVLSMASVLLAAAAVANI